MNSALPDGCSDGIGISIYITSVSDAIFIFIFILLFLSFGSSRWSRRYSWSRRNKFSRRVVFPDDSLNTMSASLLQPFNQMETDTCTCRLAIRGFIATVLCSLTIVSVLCLVVCYIIVCKMSGAFGHRLLSCYR